MAVDLEQTQNQTMSSPIGFEGYEKRLEVTFSAAHLFIDPKGHGLRSLSRAQIDSVLDLAQCTIVSSLSNDEFDSYVLSESSLFIYPHKMIIKTCGTTKLLLAIPRILELAAELSLPVLSAKYSRGSFIFPDAQPTPHRSFSEEVTVLNKFFGSLSSGGRAYVIGDPEVPNRNWHIYYACDDADAEKPMVTVEMCMTGLDSACASVFFKAASDGTHVRTAKEMTERSGISNIIPKMHICDFEFDPCGYSMNGITDGSLSTIHVTPEEGFSYASYEAMGFEPSLVDPVGLTSRVLECFQPSEFSVAVTIFGGRAGTGAWAKDIFVAGYSCRDVVEQELPGEGLLVYRTFSAQAMSPRSILNCWDEGEESDGSGSEGQKMKLKEEKGKQKKRPRAEEDDN